MEVIKPRWHDAVQICIRKKMRIIKYNYRALLLESTTMGLHRWSTDVVYLGNKAGQQYNHLQIVPGICSPS